MVISAIASACALVRQRRLSLVQIVIRAVYLFGMKLSEPMSKYCVDIAQVFYAERHAERITLLEKFLQVVLRREILIVSCVIGSVEVSVLVLIFGGRL